MNAEQMQKALGALDRKCPQPVQLIVGGGGAMVLAHHFPIATHDIDAVTKGMPLGEFDLLVKEVAMELGLPGDWLNPYFSTFMFSLPADYGDRLVPIFQGKQLEAKGLSKNDLLILKCMAHRPKDLGHARALVKAGAELQWVEDHLESLKKRAIPGVAKALDFLDEVQDLP